MLELLVVMGVISILAVAVLPRYINFSGVAEASQRDAVVGNVRSGIKIQYSNTIAAGGNPDSAYPATLDSASDGSCTSANICFTTVLQQGIKAGWTKAGLQYTHSETGSSFTYDPSTGEFQ